MSQTTPFACPSCQKKLAVPNQHLGKQIRCPGCQTVFRTAVRKTPVPPASPDPLLEIDPFASDPFGQDLSNDPFAQDASNDPFAMPSHQPPAAQTSMQPAYLKGKSGKASSNYGRPHKKKSGKRQPKNPEMTEAEQRAFGSGMFLLIVPVVATVLPLMGLQLRRLAKLGDAAPLAGIVLGLIGAGFIAYGRRNQKDNILSPILAGGFSVIMGVGGFLLLSVLHSESDLTGPGNGSSPTFANDGGFRNSDPNTDPDDWREKSIKEMEDRMAQHRKATEEMHRRGMAEAERMQREARERMQKARSNMQNGFPAGESFPGNEFPSAKPPKTPALPSAGSPGFQPSSPGFQSGGPGFQPGGPGF